MYGYRLGEDDSSGPNVYYHVTFGVSSTVFTYPEWTVRQDELFDQIYLTKLHGYVRYLCGSGFGLFWPPRIQIFQDMRQGVGFCSIYMDNK